MKEYKPRNLITIADEIINIIKTHSDLKVERADEVIRKINTLENKVSTLEGVIKDELYNLFIEKLGEPAEMKRLKKDNKRLRQQNKSLKEIIKNS